MDKKFFTAKSFEEATNLKNEYKDRARFLVGGTEMNVRVNKGLYDVLIDIGNLVSHEIKWNEDKTVIYVGSGATFQEIYKNEAFPYQLRRAAGHMSTRNIRNMATIGGNVGTGSTVGDFIPTLMVLNAQVKLFNSEELVTVEDYVNNKMQYIIEYVVLTKENLDRKYESVSYRRVSSDFSIIGAAATYKKDGEIYSDLRIAVGGMGPKAKRVSEVEALLEGKKLTREMVIATMQEKVKSRSSVLRGSAEFREYTAAEMVAQCLGL